ncbi:MAG: Ig-like domain-containing protein [Gemmatimonadaceae bacterium]
MLLVIGACGTEAATGPSAAPAAIKIGAGDKQSGIVGAALTTPLSVIVTAADGKPVSNATVSWDVAPGSGSTSSAATRTDGNGATQVTWTLGTNAGTAHLTAQVGGVNPASFTATAQPGGLSVVVALPDTLTIGVGDTVTVSSTARDSFGNDIAGSALTYTSGTPSVASVSGTGLVTALTVGTGRIVVTSGIKADTVPLTVSAAGSSLCGALALTTMTVGQVITPTSRVCLGGGAINAEYGLVAVSSSTVFATTTAFDIYGMGGVTITAPILADAITTGSAFDLGYGAFQNASEVINRDAEFARKETERKELLPLVDVAREAYAAKDEDSNSGDAATVTGFGKPAALRAVPAVNDIIKLNAQALQGCTNATLKAGRVKAVGTRSIVVADTLNPAGGYTDADYQSVAATFDTLVYPLDVENFGTPTDISGYGRVILFFTTAVNQLTPQNAGYVIGGFFFSRDLYPKTARSGLPACAGSNEAEMFYLLVPDPNGTINGNRRTAVDVTRLNLSTLAHEFQHLINASRRLYVNTGATPNEETFLDEGLSHIAEELLYYRVSGFTTRDNLNLANVGGTTTQSTNFSSYMTQNYGRLYDRLRNPELTSPYASDDSLSTRGAIWSFLRYAAGRQATPAAEATFLKSIANSSTSGIANLANVMPGGQLVSFLNDWNVATLVDDYPQVPQTQLDNQYKFPSWNFRSIYPNLRIGSSSTLGIYPLSIRLIKNNTSQRLNLAGGGAGFFRFAIPANKTGVVGISTNGGAPASSLRFSIIRVR